MGVASCLILEGLPEAFGGFEGVEQGMAGSVLGDLL